MTTEEEYIIKQFADIAVKSEPSNEEEPDLYRQCPVCNGTVLTAVTYCKNCDSNLNRPEDVLTLLKKQWTEDPTYYRLRGLGK